MIQQFYFWLFSQKEKNTNLKKYIHSNIHWSTIYNNLDMEAT